MEWIKNKRFLSIITLLLLAPAFGELLSGSQPPVEYFKLIPFLLLTMLYGVGALLVRETVRRWKKGWISIILMGMAYGIYEEGIMVRSFFDPNWPDLQVLAVYGRWIGVNWIWSIALTLFHAIISITIPILLTELLFPSQKETLWLSKRSFTIAWIVFGLNALIGPFFGMKISFLGMLASIVSIVGLALTANVWIENEDVRGRDNAKLWKIIFAGCILMILFIAGMWILPSVNFPWMLDFIFLSILPWFGVWWFNRLGRKTWKEEHQWAAAVGLLLPWIGLAVISELDNASRIDDTSGMTLVAVCFVLLLITIRLMIERRRQKELTDG